MFARKEGIGSFEMGMYTLLYFKRISSKHLLCSAESLLNVRGQPRWEGVWRRMRVYH